MPEKHSPRISSKELEERINKNIGKKGLKVSRLFTKDNEDPYSNIKFVKRDSRITNPDGSTVFEHKGVEVPESWSQVATDILAQKYFRKREVPQLDKNGNVKKDSKGNVVYGGETSAKQTVDRLAETWRHWGEKYGYFNTKKDAQSFEDELKYMLINQMVAPNSPQWFNTGLAHKYGIKGSAQGHYYADPETGEIKRSEDSYTHPQPHACFIQNVSDDLVNKGGIFDLVTREARLFKFGSGTGSNFSNLRSRGESLSGGGQSSGLMSFLKVFDTAAGSIKSGGTTRRAAKMVCVDVDHPEIEDFILWKTYEEQKVASLVAGSFIVYEHLKEIMSSAEEYGIDPEKNPELKELIKKAKEDYVPLNYIKRVLMLIENGMKTSEFDFKTYDTDFRSEAYATVSGQNANNSIRLTNEFIEAVNSKSKWNLINRTDGEVAKTIDATKLWNDIVYGAWSSADPGLQFDTTINEWHTCPEDGRINASNPCSEYMFLDDTACNLASLNLVKFYDEENHKFKLKEYLHAIRLWTVVLEVSVLMSQLPSAEIAEGTYKYRTLGLGFANMGSLLMRQGVPYDSEKGYAITGALSAMLSGEAYATSAEMASVLGTFDRYSVNKRHMLRVMRNHARAAYNSDLSEYEGLSKTPMGINQMHCPSDILEGAQTAWDYALMMGEKFGYRNAQTTAIAPTGTISLLMDCDTTGIEPDFALVKFKKLVGGGYLKLENQSVTPALKVLGYSEEEIEEVVRYLIGSQTLSGAPYINDKKLAELGFTQTELSAVEATLSSVYDLKYAFTKWTLGEEFIKNTLNISEEKLSSPDLNILKELGFTEEQIEVATEYICGTQTIEGAPHLKQEHYAVFDCANRCGTKGERYIHSDGHIRQMAASQPFISGSISKTINLPEEATMNDVSDSYMKSWELMLKCNAIYRDGSKLSQPLTVGNAENKYAKLFMFEEEEAIDENISLQEVQNLLAEASTKPVRRKLPDERHSITHKFKVGTSKGYITVGLYENGAPGEVFVTMNKEGSTLAGIVDALTYTISISLQYGVPLETLIKKYVNTRFEPAGITDNSEIPLATSIIDYIGKYLAVKFLPKERAKMYHNEELIEKSYQRGSNYRVMIPVINGKGSTEIYSDRDILLSKIASDMSNKREIEELVYEVIGVRTTHENNSDSQQSKSNEVVEVVSSHVKHDVQNQKQSISEQIGNAEICDHCGGIMQKSGTCSVCTECGATSGCS